MEEAYEDSDQREFGDIGTYIEDVDRMITNITYSGSILSASGPRCPRGDGGCGGKVVRLETIWLTHSHQGKPLNDLGRISAPPRKPRFRQQEPTPPPIGGPGQHSAPPAPPVVDLDAMRAKLKRGVVRSVLATGAFSLVVAVCWSDLISPDSFKWGVLAIPLAATAIALALGAVNLESSVKKAQEAQAALQRNHLERERRKIESEEDLRRRRAAAYERDLAAYRSSLQRHERIQRRFKRLHQIWAGSWSCTQCGHRWRSEKIDRADYMEM